MSHASETCREIRLDPRREAWTGAQRAHVDACPVCGSFLDSLTVLDERLLALPCTTQTMPDPLRGKLLSLLDEAAGPALETGAAAPRKTRSRATIFGREVRYLVPVAMAASLTMGVFLENRFDLAPAAAPPRGGEVRASVGDYIHDVTHDHYLFDKIQRPLEVQMVSADPLSDWLSTSLAFDFRLPSDSGPFALEGGRVWHTVGRLSAMAVYRAADGTRVVLFAVPAQNMLPAGAESQVIRGTQVFSGSGWGHEARAWIQGDLAVSLTAPEGHIPDGWDEVFLP